ncbi:MAG: acetyltransferase [Gammaproteobacteria bacterium]|nr:acetyltransferase [Gammaproteobacteria bacterium]MDE1887205.1 acetyltransferase [Gammaproteobacteria bacterium]
MPRGTFDGDARVLAEAVRQACLDAAREALETASLSGLCREGAEEAALDAIRALDLDKTLHLPAAGKKD